MAVSLRELFLIIRAEDHASKQLRMVGSAMRGLSKQTMVAENIARNRNKVAQMEAAIGAKNAKVLAMQDAIAAKQRTRGLFSRENANRMEKMSVATATHTARQEALTNALHSRALAEDKLRTAVDKAYASDIRLGREHFRKQGYAAQRLTGRMRADVIPTAEARRMEAMATGQAKIAKKFETSEGRLARSAATAKIMVENQAISMEKAGVSQAAFASGIESDVAAMKNLEHQILRDRAALAEFNREAALYARTAPRIAKLERMRTFGQGLAAAGRTAMFAGGAGAVGLGFAAAGAARLATESSLAATQAVTSIDQVGKKTEQVQSGILAQMQRFPAAADEMAKSIYEIFSGTNIQNSRKGLQLMAIFNKAAVAGQSDLNTATQGGLTVMNAYGKSVGDMTNIEQKMFSAVRFGRTNFTDFNQSLNQLVPAFKSANQSIETMFGSLAFLTRRMPSVRMASVSLARATEILGNTKMIKGLHKVGVEIANTRGQLLPLPLVLDRILQKFPGLAKGDNVMNWIKDLSNQQGTIQGRRALVHLFTGFPAYQKMLQQVTGDTNEFTRSYKVMAKTPSVKFQVAINQFKAIALAIGHDALPAITNLIEPLASAGKWFHNLSPGAKSATANILVFTSAILLLGGALSMLVGNLLSMYATLRIAAILGAGTKAIEGMVVAVRALSAAFAAEGLLAAMGEFGVLLASAPFRASYCHCSRHYRTRRSLLLSR